MSWRGWTGCVAVLTAVAVLAAWRGRPTSADRTAPGAVPGRIVSLTLATDEILSELVPPARLAGVTYLADDPEISNVVGHYTPEIPRLRDADVERVLAVAPDLVLVAPYNTADALELLQRSGLAVYRNEALSSLDEIEEGVRKLGERVGEAERGRRLAGRMKARRQALAERLAGVARRPRVLFWSAGFTAGRRTTLDDVIREAGGTNVAAELGLEGPAEVTPERVIAADPEVVLVMRWSAESGQIERHPILRQLRAVREGRVIAVEGRILSSVSQFAVEGAERLARLLHPGRFPPEGAP